MPSFVKLYDSILTSTIWTLRPDRDLFLTALLLAKPYILDHPEPQLCVDSLEPTGWMVPPGKYGFASAAGLGIIRIAGADKDSGIEALRRMGEPEPESRSQAHEGRRLVRVNHGYIVLNYADYRDYRDLTTAERSKRWRDKQKSNTSDTPDDQNEHQQASRVTPVTPESSPVVKRNLEGTGQTLLTLACIGQGPQEFPVRESLVLEWTAAYPGIDVLGELRKAIQWCADNPDRRKTYRGARKYLSGWLARAQDSRAKGGPNGETKKLCFAPAYPDEAFTGGERPI